MKLYGLKDEDGRGWILNVESTDLSGFSHVEPVEPEPKFKVGDWIIHSGSIWSGPHRIEHGLDPHVDDPDDRLATPQEIESHLIKIAEEKGFTIGRKFKSIFGDDGEVREIQPYCNGEKIVWRYIEYNDSLYCDSGMKTFHSFCSNPSIYKDGVWAEVLPQESKELPKTITELVQLLYDFRDADKQPKHTVRDFIIKQGYKVD
jgi:hypothetical protein